VSFSLLSFGGGAAGDVLTPFGFPVPAADAGMLAAGAAAFRAGAGTFESAGQAFSGGVGAVGVDWKGQAHAAFTGYAGHAIKTTVCNRAAFVDAAGALGGLSRAVEHTQLLLRRLVAECERAQHDQGRAQAEQQAQSQAAESLRARAGLEPHPATRTQLHLQASDAQSAAESAGRVAAQMQDVLDTAKRQGQALYDSYLVEAEGFARRLGDAAGQIALLQVPAGGAPPLVPVSRATARWANGFVAKHFAGSELMPSPRELRRAAGRQLSVEQAAALPAAFAAQRERLFSPENTSSLAAVVPGASSVAPVKAALDQVQKFAEGEENAAVGTYDAVTHPGAALDSLWNDPAEVITGPINAFEDGGISYGLGNLATALVGGKALYETGAFVRGLRAGTAAETPTIDEGNAGHIFRDTPGHFRDDTPANRSVLISTASNPDNYVGTDQWGNDWYVENNHNGSQTWARVRNGKITNGGLNNPPRNSFGPGGLKP